MFQVGLQSPEAAHHVGPRVVRLLACRGGERARLLEARDGWLDTVGRRDPRAPHAPRGRGASARSGSRQESYRRLQQISILN